VLPDHHRVGALVEQHRLERVLDAAVPRLDLAATRFSRPADLVGCT
jgi:hypothetical protein